MHAVKEPDDGVRRLGGQERLHRLHRRARITRAVRGEPALVAQLADALDGSVQAVEGLREALPGFRFPARCGRQERQGWATVLNSLGKSSSSL